MSRVVTPAQARRDPDVARLYSLTPEEVEGAPEEVTVPEGEETALDDGEELLPVTPADPSAIPDGETLISAQDAAARLGCSAGTVHRMAAAGQFPAWRVSSRWRYSWSAIAESVKPKPAAGVH